MQKKDEVFRFAIMGAGGISARFCRAAKLVGNCCVAAVASKSLERAKSFAGENGIDKYYDSYQRMLEEEKPDCVYIGVTTDAHYELSRLCLEHSIPVLCEKAMFTNSAHAREVFSLSEQKGIFAMEAMWSRFLPAVRQAKEWVAQKAIGTPVCGQIQIGFSAPRDPQNRYFSPGLGGGAAYDITVYCYEIMTYMLNRPAEVVKAEAVFGETGVDVTDYVLLRFPVSQEEKAENPDAAAFLAACSATIIASVDEAMVINGTAGKIVLPHPHYSSEAFLYDREGNCAEHFKDEVTKDGFTYEIAEAMQCIQAGKTESETVPHRLTIACAEMFDLLNECQEKE